jgi:uncharacterized membrane protein AbrB (regulator of aidB expression)
MSHYLRVILVVLIIAIAVVVFMEVRQDMALVEEVEVILDE